MRLLAGFCIMLIALLPAQTLAARYALVIGIDDYQNVPKLEKAVGDAEAMSSKLRTIGFTVTPVLNPDRRTLSQAISAFQRQIRPGDDVLVHFSGHGVEVDGNNLLLPADVPIPEAYDRDFLIGEAISLTDLMQRISDTKAATKVFIIDACRDNPFSAGGKRGLGSSRGLAGTTPTTGSFVLYSAGQGQTALDGLGATDPEPTSVYTRVLIEHLGTPGMSLTDLAKTVRKEVAEIARQVSHEQQPAYYDELTNDEFYFVASKGPEPGAEPVPVIVESADATRQAYEDAKEINSVAAWTAFLKYHPEGYYADLANAALALLQDAAVAGPNADDVRALIALMSADDAGRTLDDLAAEHYADSVQYYGKLMSRAEIIADKRAYYARWSSWSVRPDYATLTIRPAEGGKFDVSYVLDYQWNPVKGGAPVVGTARADLTVATSGGKLVIVDENTTVISRETNSPQADAAEALGPSVIDRPDIDGNFFVFLGAFKTRDGAAVKRRQLGALVGRTEIIWSSDYVGLTPGLWVTAVGPMSRVQAAGTLAEAKAAVPDAYVRQTRRVDDAPASDDVFYLTGLKPTGDNWLALRKSPDVSGDLLARMGPATLLRVISRSGEWNEVEVLNSTLRGARGWASRRYMACCL
jgi:hypothetical protein